MPFDYTDPHVLNFFIENYNREREKRVYWFFKHKDQLFKEAEFPVTYEDLRTEAVRRVPLEAYMPIFAKDYQNGMVNHRKILNIDRPESFGRRPGAESSITSLAHKSVMLPIEPNIKGICYQCMPSGGRIQYLKARNKKSPEEKYNFDETTSHVYGWRLKDSKITPQASKYGHHSTFFRDMKSRSGPHPDPHHYQPLPVQSYSKCTL